MQDIGTHWRDMAREIHNVRGPLLAVGDMALATGCAGEEAGNDARDTPFSCLSWPLVASCMVPWPCS